MWGGFRPAPCVAALLPAAGKTWAEGIRLILSGVPLRDPCTSRGETNKDCDREVLGVKPEARLMSGTAPLEPPPPPPPPATPVLAPAPAPAFELELKLEPAAAAELRGVEAVAPVRGL